MPVPSGTPRRSSPPDGRTDGGPNASAIAVPAVRAAGRQACGYLLTGLWIQRLPRS
ncbi:hypothetical protein ACFFX0_17315 [Citricoccus parietis]|uniref:Uncharacterized protein n=1 Tax=Citricoccus parietis TaxID=592307 RepID=A0ABV5G1Q5_9MICC